MNLRPILAVLLVILAGIGGSILLFSTLSGPSGPPDVTTAETPVLDPSVPAPYRGTKGEPVTVIRVGETGDGLPIQIWNAGPTERAVSIELIHNESDASLLNRTETLPPNGTVRIELRSSTGYLLEVTDVSTGTTERYPVTSEHFDCNERFAEVRVAGNGSVDSRTVSTDMGC